MQQFPRTFWGLWRKALAIIVAACIAQLVYANPVGPTVVNGSASFSNQGNLLSVTKSPGTVSKGLVASAPDPSNTNFLVGPRNFAETLGTHGATDKDNITTSVREQSYLVALNINQSGLIAPREGCVIHEAWKQIAAIIKTRSAAPTEVAE